MPLLIKQKVRQFKNLEFVDISIFCGLWWDILVSGGRDVISKDIACLPKSELLIDKFINKFFVLYIEKDYM